MEEGKEAKEDGKLQYAPIKKSSGVTAAEEYLGQLCERTFLSLWSYQSLYRDQGKPHAGGHGKEICDLLVVFGEHVVIFSDKHCELKNSGNPMLDWQRWFRKAVQNSAEQVWGAERWIRQHPTRIFLDRECTQLLPIEVPKVEKAQFHLVVVAHGISSRIRQKYGGSGSLIIDMTVKGSEMHLEPFHVGDLDPEKRFVHVLDDSSLQTLMTARDTISDFVAYLSKREKLLRAQAAIFASGEEQLLAIYLQSFGKEEEHDFVLPVCPGETVTHFVVPEGHWEKFEKSPERIAQQRRDRISYLWDALIETFNDHALKGDQHYISPGGFRDVEKILRFMARIPRWIRTTYARTLANMLENTTNNQKRAGILGPCIPGEPYYVFLLLPRPDSSVPFERYRQVRRGLLEAYCEVVKLKFPAAEDIVGIATEPGMESAGRSEDAVYLDARGWTPEMYDRAKEIQKSLAILQKPTEQVIHTTEYPVLSSPAGRSKYSRNDRCPCGSGKKYKRCCLIR